MANFFATLFGTKRRTVTPSNEVLLTQAKQTQTENNRLWLENRDLKDANKTLRAQLEGLPKLRKTIQDGEATRGRLEAQVKGMWDDAQALIRENDTLLAQVSALQSAAALAESTNTKHKAAVQKIVDLLQTAQTELAQADNDLQAIGVYDQGIRLLLEQVNTTFLAKDVLALLGVTVNGVDAPAEG